MLKYVYVRMFLKVIMLAGGGGYRTSQINKCRIDHAQAWVMRLYIPRGCGHARGEAKGI